MLVFLEHLKFFTLTEKENLTDFLQKQRTYYLNCKKTMLTFKENRSIRFSESTFSHGRLRLIAALF